MTEFAPARLPSNETGRLVSVQRSGLMDHAPDHRFTLYTDLMKQISGFPVAYCGLIDATRQYFLSQNFPDCLNLPQVGRDGTLCQFALLAPTPLVFADMRLDETMSVHPLVVGEPHFVAWAAFPLVTQEGHILGTLCVADYVPHSLPPATVDLMRRVAAELTFSIELQIAQRHESLRRVAKVAEDLTLIAGLETTEQAAAFLAVCEGLAVDPSRLGALRSAGLVAAEGGLSGQGIAALGLLGLSPSGFRTERSVLKSQALADALLDLLAD